jgi:hypothetical protein
MIFTFRVNRPPRINKSVSDTHIKNKESVSLEPLNNPTRELFIGMIGRVQTGTVCSPCNR